MVANLGKIFQCLTHKYVALPFSQEAALEQAIGMGAQLEELILEAKDELFLVNAYAVEKPWERAADAAWKADLDRDIKADEAREDAANAKTA